MKKFLKNLINENPLFTLCLGMCPALAVTTTFENGYLMGISLTIVLVLSNIIISLISKKVEEHIRIPVYIMIIGTFVTILELLLGYYAKPIANTLGIYLPLITVNCLVLGRALSYASKNKVGSSIKDAFNMGLGYTIALALIGLVREILGSNTITIMDRISNLTGYVMKYKLFGDNDFLPDKLFLTPAGAFLTIGLMLGIINALRKENSK